MNPSKLPVGHPGYLLCGCSLNLRPCSRTENWQKCLLSTCINLCLQLNMFSFCYSQTHLAPEYTFFVIFGLNISGKKEAIIEMQKCAGSASLHITHCILTIYIYVYIPLLLFTLCQGLSPRVLLKLHLTSTRSWLSSNRIPFLPSPLCPSSHCPYVLKIITPRLYGIQFHNPKKTYSVL